MRLGKTAFLPCPCQGTDGRSKTNRLDSLGVVLGDLRIGTGVVLSTVRTVDEPTYKTVKVNSKLESISLLSGLITAKSITLYSNTRATSEACHEAAATPSDGPQKRPSFSAHSKNPVRGRRLAPWLITSELRSG